MIPVTTFSQATLSRSISRVFYFSFIESVHHKTSKWSFSFHLINTISGFLYCFVSPDEDCVLFFVMDWLYLMSVGGEVSFIS